MQVDEVQLPVKTTLRQNESLLLVVRDEVQLPVKTTLRQNGDSRDLCEARVQLPVKTTLRQNPPRESRSSRWCNYQSKRRCAKT